MCVSARKWKKKRMKLIIFWPWGHLITFHKKIVSGWSFIAYSTVCAIVFEKTGAPSQEKLKSWNTCFCHLISMMHILYVWDLCNMSKFLYFIGKGVRFAINESDMKRSLAHVHLSSLLFNIHFEPDYCRWQFIMLIFIHFVVPALLTYLH